MPELPDLNVFSKNLSKRVKGKTIDSIKAVVTSKLNVTGAQLKKHLAGSAIKTVERDGKELHFTFSNGDVLAVHLMLHGAVHLFEGKNDQKHTILEITFDDNTGLVITDWQKAATLTLNPPAKEAPDALDKAVNEGMLEKAFKTRSAVKKVLMDQKVIRGIGNAYADEILWDARISPFSVANKIPGAAIKKLAKSIRKVLKDAEKQIVKTHPDIVSGEVRDFLAIHNAKKKNSPGGSAIEHKSLGGRITYYTDEQELFE